MKNLNKEVYTMRRYDLTGSMKQSTSPFLMKDEEFTYLRNVSYDEIGSIGKDGGYTQLGGDLDVSGKCDLLHLHVTNTGIHTGLAIANGKLFKFGEGAWSSINTSTFTADSKCTAVNRGGLSYIVNPEDGLHYTDGTTVTSVSSDNGGSEIQGKYVVALDNQLYVANLSGTHTASDVVFTVDGGNTFYVPTEEGANTYATTANIFSATDAITGITAFQGTVVYFTEEEMYLFNPANNEVHIIAKIGCTSHDSIQEINGVLYWVNRDGVYRFNGENLPELISIPITNWAVNSLWRLIDGSNWSSISAVSFEGKYIFSVGDLVGILPGDSEAMSNAVIVYDTYRDVWYFLTDHPVGVWLRYINDEGNLRLLFSDSASAKVYQKDYSYSADGSAIEMVIRTKYFHFDMPENEKVLENLFFTCRPSASDGYYMTVKMAKNGTNYYEEYLADDTVTKVELDGVSGTEFDLKKTTMKGTRVRTASYEFSNVDNGINMTLLGYTQQYRYLNNNMNWSI